MFLCEIRFFTQLSSFEDFSRNAMEEHEESNEVKFVRKNSGKAFKSRPHGKAEKRKQRKAWRKRKRERAEPNAGNEHVEPRASKQQRVEEPHVNPVDSAAPTQTSVKLGQLQRGKMLVGMALKARKTVVDIPKSARPDPKQVTEVAKRKSDGPTYHEINRELLVIDATKKIGSGTFGKCFSAMYRGQYSVVVKVMKTNDDSFTEKTRAKREVLHEATVFSRLGDHPGVPHLFGVCTEKAPYYLVLEQHYFQGRSITVSEAVKSGVIADKEDCVKMLRNMCETLIFIHSQGYLHNDLKGNNVLLSGPDKRPVIIDFGKSVEIAKARLTKPKVNFDKARERYPHVAPELHRGARPNTSSDVFSFGAMVLRILKKGKFQIPSVQKIAEECVSTSPKKRPAMEEVLRSLK